MAGFEIPEGWTVQAFQFTLDPTAEQSRALARHFGARRKAYNWAVAALKADIQAWRATGVQTTKPSMPVLQRGVCRWHQGCGRCVLELAAEPHGHTRR